MKRALRPVHRVGPGAELLDEFGRPDHGLEHLGQEGGIAGNAIDIGGDADELALRVEFDVAAVAAVDRAVDVENRRDEAMRVNAFGIPQDVVLGLVGKARPEQGEGLRGAVANPGAVVIARPGLEGESGGVDQNERRLRLDGVADFAIPYCDSARADLVAPPLDHSLADGAENPSPPAARLRPASQTKRGRPRCGRGSEQTGTRLRR